MTNPEGSMTAVRVDSSWCGFVATRREHRVVYNWIADERVAEMLDLARALLADNAEHVAACCRIEE